MLSAKQCLCLDHQNNANYDYCKMILLIFMWLEKTTMFDTDEGTASTPTVPYNGPRKVTKYKHLFHLNAAWSFLFTWGIKKK